MFFNGGAPIYTTAAASCRWLLSPGFLDNTLTEWRSYPSMTFGWEEQYQSGCGRGNDCLTWLTSNCRTKINLSKNHEPWCKQRYRFYKESRQLIVRTFIFSPGREDGITRMEDCVRRLFKCSKREDTVFTKYAVVLCKRF